MNSNDTTTLSVRVAPASRLAGVQAYAPPKPPSGIDLWLDANEGAAPVIDASRVAACGAIDTVRRYPSTQELEALIAQREGVDPSRVLVTAGGDEAIDRLSRAYLEPGRALVFPAPSFEMIATYARLAGASVRRVAWWGGDFPVQRVIDAAGTDACVIAAVSPNNPTGACISPEHVRALSIAAPSSIVLVDCAYEEFADVPLTQSAIALPNAVVVRTFSKAYGLAGVRVGYAIGSREVIESMRAAGSPYSVSGISVQIASAAIQNGGEQLRQAVERVRFERVALASEINSLGGEALCSQANFVLARVGDAPRLWSQLSSRGIAVRKFSESGELACSVRITCPGSSESFERLLVALRLSGPSIELRTNAIQERT